MAWQNPKTLYDRLGVELSAPQFQIRQAYIRLARQWHPDRHRGDDGGAAQRRFQEIQEAYEVLMDAQRRRAYDMQLLHLLDVEEYLSRFHELVLTVNGLDMALPRSTQEELLRQHQQQQQQPSPPPRTPGQQQHQAHAPDQQLMVPPSSRLLKAS